MEVINNRVKQLEQELAAAKQELHQLKSKLSTESKSTDWENGLKEFYEFTISEIPGQVYWVDRNNVFLGCNKEQAITAGLKSPADIVGKKLTDIIPAEDAARLEQINNQVMETGKTYTANEEYYFPSEGKTTWLSKKVPLYSKNNDVIGLLGISINITDQKKAEEMAIENMQIEREKELKQFYEYIISKLPGHVYWTDKNGVYLGCNDEQADHLGMNSPQEIKGKRTSDLLPPDQAEKIDQINEEVMRTEQTYTVEEECLFSKKSSQFMYSKKVPLYDKHNQVNGILGMSIDISDRKTAERLAVENARIEKEKEEAQKYAERMKTIASNISHEHKTPLAGIKITVQIIQQLFPKLVTGYKAAVASDLINEPLPAERIDAATDLFNKALTQIDRATTMVSIQLYNMQHDKFQTKYFKMSSIANAVNEALTHYPFTEGERALIHESLTADFQFYGDPLLLQHVIWNLLKNALHFIKEEDKGEITLWLESSNEFNTLHFKDTAKGMSQEETNLIFDAFYSKRSGGSGLGLAFCQSVMEAFAGKIQCSAEENGFTAFTLCFPKIEG